jgi:Xaa-Pro dipeptidase
MRKLTPTPDSQFVDDDRLPKVRETIAQAEVEGLLALSPANSYYLTGCYAGMYSRPVAGLITQDTSVFVGPALEARKADRTAWTDQAVLYEDADAPFEILAEVVKETGVTSLGIDRAVAQAGWVDQLTNSIDVDLVDLTGEYQSLRMVKTDWELDMIRRAADLAGAGMEAYLETIAIDTPELSVANAIQDAYYETYLEWYPSYDIGTANELGQYGFASVLAGSHALEPHSISSAREINSGDSIVGIALPSLQGYVCEEERTVLAGDVSDEIYQAMGTLVDVRRGTIERIESGVGVDEIDAWTAQQLKDAGYGSNLIHRTGHGEGITIHEGPALNARKDGMLKPGMVISVEPGLYFPDQGIGLRHSDTLIITENGSDRLTHSDDGVLTID